jgi:ferredoxin-NADP reductase/ferredoxin
MKGGASLPPAGGMDLTVRDKPGGFVAPYLLNEVQVGDELETTGPAGSFYYEPLIDGDDMVFLAGGSGITPFMSIIRDALRRDLPPFDGLRAPLKIHLLYGSRVPDDVIFGDELAELADRHSNFNYTLVISEPLPGHTGDRKGRPYLTGFLGADLIREQIGDVKGKTFYICGPGAMCDFCLVALAELGVPPHRIRRELYGPPDDVTKEPGWPEGLSADAVFEVEVVNLPPARGEEEAAFGAVGQLTSVPPASGGEERGGQTIRAPAGEPLMNTLERYGVVVPAVCRSGVCSACRIRLLSGRVFAPADTGLRESDKEHGYIHACVSYPLEDLRIRI